MSVLKWRKPRTTYGTDDFAATLAEREAALGITQTVPATTQAVPAAVLPDASPADAPAEPGAASSWPGRREGYDAWGNELLSGDEDGAHVIRSQWDGRIVRVCAEYRTGKHNVWWAFDETEMRPVCSVCWPQWAKGR